MMLSTQRDLEKKVKEGEKKSGYQNLDLNITHAREFY